MQWAFDHRADHQPVLKLRDLMGADAVGRKETFGRIVDSQFLTVELNAQHIFLVDIICGAGQNPIARHTDLPS